MRGTTASCGSSDERRKSTLSDGSRQWYADICDFVGDVMSLIQTIRSRFEPRSSWPPLVVFSSSSTCEPQRSAIFGINFAKC